jgi:hypothetical protein
MNIYARFLQWLLASILAAKKHSRRIVAVVVAAATIPGVGSMWTYFIASINERHVAEVRELTTFGNFATIVNQSYDNQLAAASFVSTHLPYTETSATALIKRYGSGSAAFNSPELAEFRKIHFFYEELGLQVEKGVVDFDLIFELVTFPSNFHEHTKTLCDQMGESWFGLPKKGESHDEEIRRKIFGMCSNTESLNQHYLSARQIYSECKEPKQLSWLCRKTKEILS